MNLTWTLTTDKIPELGQKCFYFYRYIGVHRGVYDNWPEECSQTKNGIAVTIPATSGFEGVDGGWEDDNLETYWMPDVGQDKPEGPEPTEILPR